MRSRLATRLFTVLMLVLAGLSGFAGSFAVARCSHITVCAGDQQPSRPPRVNEQAPHPVAPPPVHIAVSAMEQRPPDVFFRRDLFQRPPPDALLIPA